MGRAGEEWLRRGWTLPCTCWAGVEPRGAGRAGWSCTCYTYRVLHPHGTAPLPCGTFPKVKKVLTGIQTWAGVSPAGLLIGSVALAKSLPFLGHVTSTLPFVWSWN